MKKIKLLSLVLSGILAASAMSGTMVSAADELYEVPDSITSLSELKEYITEPVTITAEDFVRLSGITEEELIEFFKSGGMNDEQVSDLTKIYYEGARQILEAGWLYTIHPKDYNDGHKPAFNFTPIEYVTETSGTFESGVTYFYNEETKGLVFDGAGVLSTKDFCRASNSFSEEFVFIGKDVTVECEFGARSSILYMTRVDEDLLPGTGRGLIPFFTFENSTFTKQFDAYLDEMVEKGADEKDYVYYTVEDGTDPNTFVNPLEPIDDYVKITEYGFIGNGSSCLEKPQWHYTGTKAAGGSIVFLIPVEANPFELEEMLEVTDKFNVTNIEIAFYSEPDMTCLPAELQGFETVEEVNNELLNIFENRNTRVEPLEGEYSDVAIEATESTETTTTVATEAIETTTAVTEATDTTEPTTSTKPVGDTNGDDKIDARDCSFIAVKIASGEGESLPDSVDFNGDKKVNVRDAAAIANFLAEK